jgi:hypothetical protein
MVILPGIFKSTAEWFRKMSGSMTMRPHYLGGKSKKQGKNEILIRPFGAIFRQIAIPFLGSSVLSDSHGQSPMDTTLEAEPSREHRTRSLALSALGRCMGMAGSLARAGDF